MRHLSKKKIFSRRMKAEEEDREDMVASLCSYSNCDKEVAIKILSKSDWNFEEASIEIYEEIKRKKRETSTATRTVRIFVASSSPLFFILKQRITTHLSSSSSSLLSP